MKAKALKKGDLITIIAPASAPIGQERVQKSVEYFEKLGYRVTLGKHFNEERGYLAGSDKSRLSDIHAAFANPKIRAIFFIRGGYGTIRLLSEVDYDLIARNPKIFVGYSDATSLFLAIYKKTKLSSLFFGPMPGVDIWDGFDPFAEENFWRALTSTSPLGKLPMNPEEGILIGKKKRFDPVRARLLGGNLSVLGSLLGTQYLPSLQNAALFLEEIDERPYKVDRHFAQLRAMGVFEKARAIMLGQFTRCQAEPGRHSLSLDEVLSDYFGKLEIPVISNLPFGHVKRQWTMPLGAQYEVAPKKSTAEISIVESALEK